MGGIHPPRHPPLRGGLHHPGHLAQPPHPRPPPLGHLPLRTHPPQIWLRGAGGAPPSPPPPAAGGLGRLRGGVRSGGTPQPPPPLRPRDPLPPPPDPSPLPPPPPLPGDGGEGGPLPRRR